MKIKSFLEILKESENIYNIGDFVIDTYNDALGVINSILPFGDTFKYKIEYLDPKLFQEFGEVRETYLDPIKKPENLEELKTITKKAIKAYEILNRNPNILNGRYKKDSCLLDLDKLLTDIETNKLTLS